MFNVVFVIVVRRIKLYVIAFCNSNTARDSKKYSDTSLAAKGALADRLQNSKWPPGGPKMANGVWKGVYS